MRRAVALTAAVAALAVLSAPTNAAMDHGEQVSIGFASYTPPAIDVVRGETITWTNDSVRNHTVTSGDSSWDSGVLTSGDHFSRRFDADGDFPYYCRLHAGITGKVTVHDLLLDAPAGSAAPGRAFPLSGRSALPAGTVVTIEADSGSGFAPVTTATVSADGSFAASVVPQDTTSYRASADGRSSQTVQLLVLDHHVTRIASSRGRHITVVGRVTPAAPGATMVLQLRLEKRFGWWPVKRAKLDSSSRARFRLTLRHRYAARIVMTLPDGATPLATSRPIEIGPF